jgi:predicted Zn-dependent protease
LGYRVWYRHQVQVGAAGVEAARRLSEGTESHAARQAYAEAAYATDDFERAAQLYRELLDVRGASTGVLWGLAISERRLGRHRVELALYQALLSSDPENPRLLSALATAAARFSRYHEAHALLTRARSGLHTPRAVDLSSAVVYALEGDDRKALRFLERVLQNHDELEPAEQLEFARDLALDPAFARLRGERRLRSLLARQLGAAAPLPIW